MEYLLFMAIPETLRMEKFAGYGTAVIAIKYLPNQTRTL